MRVLLATGIEQLDKDLQERLGENASVCYYREAVVAEAGAHAAEVVVLSVSLPGTAAVEDLILELRMANRRVILLPGERGGNERLVRRAVALGVYDLIYDPVTIRAVMEHIEHPAALADVGKVAFDVELEEIPESPPEVTAVEVGSAGEKQRRKIREEGWFKPWVFRKKVVRVGVFSFLPRIGVTTFALTAARILAKYGPTALVDADLEKPGLGIRLGYRPADLASLDWRYGARALAIGRNLEAWLLDPYGDRSSLKR